MIRKVTLEDLDQVNNLRKQALALHVKLYPNIFKKSYADSLSEYTKTYLDEEDKCLLVYEAHSKIVGCALIKMITKPETAYRYQLRYIEIEELVVDKKCRRQGVGRALIDFIKTFAKENGYNSIQLNVWNDNIEATKFYESLGMTTLSKQMKIDF